MSAATSALALTDPEFAFVGAVLHLPASAAHYLCEPLFESDFADPRLRLVLCLAKGLAAQGVSPGPAEIMAESKRVGAVSGPHGRAELSKLVHDLFHDGAPWPSAEFLRQSVLEGCLRRRIAEAGQRLQQAADEVALADLIVLVAVEHKSILDAGDRWRAHDFRLADAQGEPVAEVVQ